MDLTPVTTTYAIDDNSWLDSQHGTDATVPVTLDASKFDASQYANGFIPSGCALGVVTASGLYGPYDDGASDGRQTLVGHLYGGVAAKSTSVRIGAALLRHGFVKINKLPFQSGQTGAGFVDAAGQADVKGSIGYRTA